MVLSKTNYCEDRIHPGNFMAWRLFDDMIVVCFDAEMNRESLEQV